MIKRVMIGTAAIATGLVALLNLGPVSGASAVAQPRRPTTYGINLSTLASWNHDRSFMNLMAGGGWLSTAQGKWHQFDADRIGRDGTVLSLMDGEKAVSVLSYPPGSYNGDVRMRCTFQGKGKVNAFAGRAASQGRGTLDFIWPKGKSVSFLIEQTDPADPVRRVDCREAAADRTELFDPLFIDTLKSFSVVRFLDWQRANTNPQVTWATRSLPGSPIVPGPDGVPVEHMVTLANQAGIDPWFVMPWNADADYMERFARYVHDNLKPDRTAYVEIGNEVWNYSFKVAHQVLEEARTENLNPDLNNARAMRYAEHAVEMLKIWNRIFGGDRKRLVRVLSWQAAWPDSFKAGLSFKDTAQQADALAMAPYFGVGKLEKTGIDTSDTNAVFSIIPAAVDRATEFMRRDKALADRFGLRLIAYESGQSLIYSGPDKTVIGRLNRDPRMGDLYRRYLAAWDREAGDLIMLFANVTPITAGAAWGLQEYPGQPLSETPKRQAVLEAIDQHRRK